MQSITYSTSESDADARKDAQDYDDLCCGLRCHLRYTCPGNSLFDSAIPDGQWSLTAFRNRIVHAAQWNPDCFLVNVDRMRVLDFLVLDFIRV